jgi:hypothetical protein
MISPELRSYPRCITCTHWVRDSEVQGSCKLFAALPLPQNINVIKTGTYPFPLEKPLRTHQYFGCLAHDAPAFPPEMERSP